MRKVYESASQIKCRMRRRLILQPVCQSPRLVFERKIRAQQYLTKACSAQIPTQAMEPTQPCQGKTAASQPS